MELNRLVLLDEVPANAETWAQACAFRLAAARGVRGVVAHSDPEPRTRLTAHGPELIFPGHYGTIYQAKGMDYLGKTHPRRLTMLPDGSVLHIGVRAGSYRLLVSITTACQQAGAGLPVRRSMV